MEEKSLIKKISSAFVFTAVLFLCLCFFSSCSISLRDVKPETEPAETETETERETETSPETEKPETSENPGNIPPEKPIEYEEGITESEIILSTEANMWVERYNQKYGDGRADEVILSKSEIEEYNCGIIDNCPTVTDMTEVPDTIPGSDILNMIKKYPMPVGDKFNRHGEYIRPEEKNKIIENTAPDSVEGDVNVRLGIVADRCDLKGFPTHHGFYEENDPHFYYSAIQETELVTGFPVFILHESRDGEFLFVQSYYYAGWVEKSKIAEADKETYLAFAEPEKYITITEPTVVINGTTLSMGCKLPYVSEDGDSFHALLPKSTDGLEPNEVSIPKTAAYYGSLPYTMKNYYNQAFKYLGTMYGWGGADGGVDCSGFVCSVFRSFGIYLPRNAGEQAKYSGGEAVELDGLSPEDMSFRLSKISHPASVHRKGHVMLYLGEFDGVQYIIHSPQGGEAVCETRLSLPGGLTVARVIH